jgi:hypothetical protein
MSVAPNANVLGAIELWCYTTPNMLTVAWPSHRATRAEVWRVLDLSGLTKSVRDSRNFLRAGYVYLDGERLFSLQDTVEIGKPFLLELRFPNGVTERQQIYLTRLGHYKPRSNTPLRTYYKP